MDRGCFIVFEGPEGGGKTLQAAALASWLRSNENATVQCREPGGTPLGERIRDVLLGRIDYAILPEAETLLLSAARAQLVRTVISPALQAAAVVICDRYVYSTLAYQGGGSELSLERLRQVSDFATGGLQPDLVLLLDVPVEIGLKRRLDDPGTVNRIDLESQAFHRRVRATYLDLAESDPGRWIKIDASLPPNEVAREVRESVKAHLPGLKTDGQMELPWMEPELATKTQ